MRTLKSLPPKQKTAMTVAKIFAESYMEVFSGANPPFELSPAMHFIEVAQTGQRLSSMLDFSGAINGFVIVNYPEEGALDTVKHYQMMMGLPEEDAPKAIGVEVQDCLGEILNQALGKFRKNLEKIYDIKTKSYTPITMVVNNMLILSPADGGHKYNYVRLQINTPSAQAIFVEFCIQEIVFVLSEEVKPDERSPEEIMEESKKKSEAPAAEENGGTDEETDELLKNLFG